MLSSKTDKSDLERANTRDVLQIFTGSFNAWFFALLFCALFMLQSNFNRAFADTSIQEPIWQNVVNTLPHASGIFNRHLRQTVQQKLVLPNITASLSDSLPELNARLQVLDKALFQYIRVSESSTRFDQLRQLMPALYNIEERKLIEQFLKNQGEPIPRLRNSRLLGLLDRRISRLANGLVFNMKTLVRERRDYEPDLLKAMASNGVVFSARPPDFILNYYLQPNGKDAKGLWTFYAKIELLNRYEMPIVTVNEQLTQSSQTRETAQVQSVHELAKLVTNQLKEFLIHSVEK
ncbi:hypothetical protein [Thiomicrorhabdus sp. Kp2]|uniref:hypothetical protein n=1 Tax=Thiomicrorhabdus sp. Kp2 TaxID=1123518 RepID=UPI00040B341F|nr:hypothetical protein [Thiomicrorhabdus sp. Kp2]